ncbi:hypothetical protein MP638_005676 [Amoeboaphelidium occidentale]|nr:hypothetical protein MP638_005676 [Amoeboaphelidium occidentale]
MADHHENTQPSNVQQTVNDDHQFSPTDIPLGVRINIEDLNDHESNERDIKSAPSVDNENEKRVSDTINDSSIHARPDSDDYSFEGLSHRRKAFDLAKMSEMQKKLYYFFEEPVGIPAKCFQFLSYFLILYSTIEVAVETLPEFTSPDGSSFLPTMPGIFAMECFIFIVWSVELLGRIYASTNRILFWSDILNWVDLVAILPFFFSLFKISDPFLQNLARILRLTRVTKAVKLARYSEGVRLGSRALARSMDAIWMLLFFLFLSVLFSSSIMFWVERGTWNAAERKWIRVDGTPSPFSSIPVGFYWSMVTLATVGYGDVVPITPLGKFVASLTMILSIMIIALPTSIIGSNFIAEWQIYQQQVLQKKMRNFKLQAQKSSEETSELDIVSSRDRFRLVTEQNIIMVQAIGEIQEKLNDLNPPQYYQLYKKKRHKSGK